jgi:anti-sigma regulatory factor (Ser/Thr protein kinase)
MALIKDAIAQTIILAYKEDTQPLEACFTEQGFDCQVIRQKHKTELQVATRLAIYACSTTAPLGNKSLPRISRC